MLYDLLIAVWFMLPAATANVVPVFTAVIPGLKKFTQPLDFNATFHGKRIFGDHKTWRGLISGMIAATLVFGLQKYLVTSFDLLQPIQSTIDYDRLPLLIIGPLFAIGALGGDAIASFFKRQIGIKSGQSWVPFDQLDYIIGSVLAMLPFVVISLRQYILVFLVWFVVHIASTIIGYLIGVKKDPI